MQRRRVGWCLITGVSIVSLEKTGNQLTALRTVAVLVPTDDVQVAVNVNLGEVAANFHGTRDQVS